MKGSKGDPKRSPRETETGPEQDSKRLTTEIFEIPNISQKVGTGPEQDAKRFTAGTSGEPDEAHSVSTSCNPHDNNTECPQESGPSLDEGCNSSRTTPSASPHRAQRTQCFGGTHVPGTINSARSGKGGRRSAGVDGSVGPAVQVLHRSDIHEHGAEVAAGIALCRSNTIVRASERFVSELV
jgi:hypothetical protein